MKLQFKIFHTSLTNQAIEEHQWKETKEKINPTILPNLAANSILNTSLSFSMSLSNFHQMYLSVKLESIQYHLWAMPTAQSDLYPFYVSRNSDTEGM